MKNYLSITNEFLKNRIYKLLLVLAAMGIADALVAFLAVKKAEKFMLGYIFSNPGFMIILFLEFALCMAICLEKKTGYDENDKKVYYCMGLANALSLLMVWLVQAVIITVIALYLITLPECSEKSIGLYMDFERTAYMHAMLPVGDISIVIRNLIFAAGLGFNLTMLKAQLKNKEIPYTMILLLLIIGMEFSMRYGNALRNYIFSGTVIVLTIICIIRMNLTIVKKQGKDVD